MLEIKATPYRTLQIAFLTFFVAASSFSAEYEPLPPIDKSGPRKLRAHTQGFGQMPNGENVYLHTLVNDRGLKVKVMSYGATLLAVETPDRDGKLENITLYLEKLEDYLQGHPLLGSTVGRYANRIDTGGFTIDGTRHDLKTVGRNGVHIHGGKEGLQRLNWRLETSGIGEDSAFVVYAHTSPDGHEGFPGKVTIKATYRLTNNNELFIQYEAETTRPTHLNLANHAYWNLSGAGSGDVLQHRLVLNADRYLAIDKRKIPTGDYRNVAGTPFDFLSPHTIGERIEQVDGGGYDHCYVINREGKANTELVLCARVEDPKSGRAMEVLTTHPGVQIYTANYLNPKFKAKTGAYGRHHAICLETQHFPDSPNKPGFPSTLFRPGQVYRQTTIHRFRVMD